MGILYIPAFFLIPLSIVLLFILIGKKSVPSREKQMTRLDRVGRITNLLLLILYLPLSLLGSLAGMVSDGYFNGSPAQLFLCDLIGLFGFCTPLVLYGGLFMSHKLRCNGHSLQSFLGQFTGIIYLLFIFALIALLDFL